MKRLVRQLLWIPFFSIQGAWGVVVLQYHHISDTTPKSTSISPALFREHMEYLEKNKFRIMSSVQLKKIILNNEPLPNHTVVITFDDGYKSVYETAYPELKKRKWPFTVFVNTKPHDEKNPLFMSWEQLRKISKKGAIVANHTDSHPHLIRNISNQEPKIWREQRFREISFAEKRIKKELGKSYKQFAYPYGEYDTELQNRLVNEGYIAFGQQSGPVLALSTQIPIARFPFGGNYGQLSDFETKVNSLPFPSAKMQVVSEDGRPLSDPELPVGVERPLLKLISPLFQVMEGVNCFATGQGKINVEKRGGAVHGQANKALPVGRSKYNCTMNAGGGRFYWYSQFFIRRLNNGQWYSEK